MSVNYTDEQKKVIYLRNENILVSAAAGSGKTAVLVERIIQRICDAENPVDIDRLLIVTFTNAAAAEMRERISNAIAEKLAEYPENEHLQKQSALIHNALITTIDSFCLFVIRNYFQDIQLDPGFRIADEGETELVKQEALTEVLEEAFSGGNEDFFRLVECYSTGKRETILEEAIRTLHRFAMSNPWPEKWLMEHANDYEFQSFEQFEQSELWKYGMTYVKSLIPELYEQMKMCQKICEEPDGPAVYGENIEKTAEQLEKVCEAMTYDELQSALSLVTFDRLPVARKEQFHEKKIELVQNIRKDVKKKLEKIEKDYFQCSKDNVLRQCKEISPVIKTLIELTMNFSGRFEEKKREKNLIDFMDMEHLALQILCREENGKTVPTSAALQLRDFFTEIMIDEYQDSNYIQECILSCISGESVGNYNRFMVGDVKQSIYKFRLARPELFMEKYRIYDTEKGPLRRIDLNKNFRSRESVLASINVLFEQLMAQDFGKIEYDEAAKLYMGASYPSYDNPTEFLLIEHDDTVENAEQEAAVIAMRIKKLLREEMVTDKETKQLRPIRYDDVVILLRSGSGYDEVFKRVLEEQEIPCFIESKTGYFQTKEVNTILQVLQVLNNPLQDISFYGVLKSYFGGFDDTEISRIVIAAKAQIKNRYLYQKVCDFQEEGMLKQKVDTFLTWYHNIRAKLSYMSITELLELLIKQSGYLEIITAMVNGRQKRANVEMLLQKACAFERTSFKGLNHFIRYIEQIQKYNIDYGEAGILEENSNVVRIMTIHKSKGLEFPVCILAGAGRKFNKTDASMPVLTDVDMGIAVDYVNPDIRLRQKTLRKNIMASKILLDAQAEELRVLYVALTRAKEKLIITGVIKSVETMIQKYQAILKYQPKILPYHIRTTANSYMELLLPAIMRTPGMQSILEAFDYEMAKYIFSSDITVRVVKEEDIAYEKVKITEKVLNDVTSFKNDLINTVIDKGMQENLQKKFEYVYPYRNLQDLYVKTTVSELKMAKLEKEDKQQASQLFAEETIEAYLPGFIRKEETIGGATRGSAMHRVMELIDFTKEYNQKSLLEFLNAKVEEGVLSSIYEKAVSVEKILHFLETPLAKRMKNAKLQSKLYLEQPFVLGIPANRLKEEFPENEQILIQGIIDAFFVEDDNIILLDYKTDVIDSSSQLIDRYEVQLRYYQEALERILGKKVSEKLIYSFYFEEVIPVK